jgi:type IV pilus assembly protein PilO
MAIDFKDLAKLKWYYQVLLVAVMCGGLLAGFRYYYLAPIQTEIDSKNAKLNELQQIIAKSTAQEARLQEIKKEATELQAKLDKLKAVLPLEKETDQIFRAVQHIATLSGLRVQRVAPRALVDHEIYTEYPIDLDIIGTYHNVGSFLDRIRQLPRIVSIGGLKLQSRSSEGETAVTSSVNATYTATTYVYKDEPIESTAPAPKAVN